MKLKFIPLLVLALAFVCTEDVNAQNFPGLDKSPHDISYYRTSRDAAPLIKVIYGRPQLKGRQIGTQLARYNKVWRTGANEATEITFYKDVRLGDKSVKAGTYTLFTIPGEKEWTVILNKDLNSWGAFSYDEAKDVARIKVPVSKGEESVEAFAIAFKEAGSGVHMVLAWDTLRIEVPIMM